MKNVRRIICLCVLCCFAALLAVPCMALTAPTDLPTINEDLFPVAGCEYDDIFLRTLYVDGAYTTAASDQLRLLFEEDTDNFINALCSNPSVIEDHVLRLLVYSYYYTEEDILWLKDRAVELKGEYPIGSVQMGMAQDIKDRAVAIWEENYAPEPTTEPTTEATVPSEPEPAPAAGPASGHTGCIIACAVLAAVIVVCTVINVRVKKR